MKQLKNHFWMSKSSYCHRNIFPSFISNVFKNEYKAKTVLVFENFESFQKPKLPSVFYLLQVLPSKPTFELAMLLIPYLLSLSVHPDFTETIKVFLVFSTLCIGSCQLRLFVIGNKEDTWMPRTWNLRLLRNFLKCGGLKLFGKTC